jgi:hypothetical protein
MTLFHSRARERVKENERERERERETCVYAIDASFIGTIKKERARTANIYIFDVIFSLYCPPF